MKQNILSLILLVLISLSAISSTRILQSDNKILSIYWCGFSAGFCGKSQSDDVYGAATHVIMAYSYVSDQGYLIYDVLPTDIIDGWKNDGRKVLLSIGAFPNTLSNALNNEDNFLFDVTSFVNDKGVDGIDIQIDLDNSQHDGELDLIIDLFGTIREELGDDPYIIATLHGIKSLDDLKKFSGLFEYVNYVQVLQYNSYGIKDFVEDSQQESDDWTPLDLNKLILSVFASEEAQQGQSDILYDGDIIEEGVLYLWDQDLDFKGINIWNSYYDAQNENELSKLVQGWFELEILEGEEQEGEEDGEEIPEEGEDEGEFYEGEEGICYIGECGCPGSFKEFWCQVDVNILPEGYCQINATTCGQCAGTWCDEELDDGEGDDDDEGSQDEDDDDDDEDDDQDDEDEDQDDGSGICYQQECGCPPNFLSSWCTDSNVITSSWCNENATQCGQCAGKWCTGQGSGEEEEDLDQDQDQVEDQDGSEEQDQVEDEDEDEDSADEDEEQSFDGENGICYQQECGCPPNFLNSWCSESSVISSSWCGENADQCGQCAGTWCPQQADVDEDEDDEEEDEEEGDEDEDQDAEYICYLAECGCPGSFKESWCSESSLISSTWCGQSESNCKSCFGAWCEV